MATKLSELMLYVASKSQGDRKFGAVKFNKILFAIDFTAYGNLGHSITGSAYIRMEQGFCPKELPATRYKLIESKRADMQLSSFKGKSQKRLIPLDQPDMSLFSDEERQLIDDVIEELYPFTATQLSQWNHSMLPWLFASDMEEIPYFTVFTLYNKPVGRDGLDWAERRLEELRSTGGLP